MSPALVASLQAGAPHASRRSEGLEVLVRSLSSKNPVVSGEAFCNREKETNDLVRAMEGDEAPLAIRPKLAPHVRLEQICEQGGGQLILEGTI